MEFVDHTLYNNQDLQAFHLQEIPQEFPDTLLNQNLVEFETMLFEYQIERYETVLKDTLTQNTPQKSTKKDEEGVLSAKELKNLNTWKSQTR